MWGSLFSLKWVKVSNHFQVSLSCHRSGPTVRLLHPLNVCILVHAVKYRGVLTVLLYDLQATFLQNMYSSLQRLQLNITMLKHHRILKDTADLTDLLERQLCAIRSMLIAERRLFDESLEVPRCTLRKPEWWQHRHSHIQPSCSECINYAINMLIEARRDFRQYLTDLDQFFDGF